MFGSVRETLVMSGLQTPQTTREVVTTTTSLAASSSASSCHCGAQRLDQSCRRDRCCCCRRSCRFLLLLLVLALVHPHPVAGQQAQAASRSGQQDKAQQQQQQEHHQQPARKLKSDTTAPNLETFSCGNQPIDPLSSSSTSALETYLETKCDRQTKSSSKINTGDLALDNAHNYLIDVHKFYLDTFQRNSVDGKGRKLRSYVHFGVDYNDWELNYYIKNYTSSSSSSSSNSLSLTVSSFRGDRLIYGDGDGFSWTYSSKCLDRVAWTFSKGVTDYTSELELFCESGALYVAFSDVMAATIDRLVGKKTLDGTWRIGEDCDLNPSDGLGIRNMANPSELGQVDHYNDRHFWSVDDDTGIKANSGIINKVFYLMVQGGVHNKSKIVVPPLSTDFDTSITIGATIFYQAFTDCMVKTSDFISARECTEDFAEEYGGGNSDVLKATVSTAWEAVGITEPEFLPLSSKIPQTGLACGLIGQTRDQLFFRMTQVVGLGQGVTCKVNGPNGNPDLYVKFGRRPRGRADSDCFSEQLGPADQCTTGPALEASSVVYVTVVSWVASTDMTLECYVNDGCKLMGTKCKRSSECCGTMVCDGPSVTTKTCKPCINPCPAWSFFCGATNKACRRNSQCCKGHKCSVGSKRCL